MREIILSGIEGRIRTETGSEARLGRIGPGRALELLWSHRTIAAEEAWRSGLVDRLIDDQTWEEEIDDFTARLAALPQPAVRLSKLAMQQNVNLDFTSMLALEWERR